MLNELEDGELKTSLVNAFGNVKLDFNQAIDKRDAIKQDFNNYKEQVKQKLGTDIDSYSPPKPSDDLAKLKADYEAKYNADMQKLREDIGGWESKYNEANKRLEDYTFNAEVEKQGLLNGFLVENPRVKEMLLSEIRERLILENGALYVKDGTGEKSRDIKTGEYMPAVSVSNALKASAEWHHFVKPEAKANGGGSPVGNQATGGNTKKFSDYSASELVELRRTNPTKYDQLKIESGMK